MLFMLREQTVLSASGGIFQAKEPRPPDKETNLRSKWFNPSELGTYLINFFIFSSRAGRVMLG